MIYDAQSSQVMAIKERQALEMVSANNSNIVEIRGHFNFRSHKFITYELLECTLERYLHRHKMGRLPSNIVLRFAKHILGALRVLREAHVIHGIPSPHACSHILNMNLNSPFLWTSCRNRGEKIQIMLEISLLRCDV